jgi:hypothetical protein
MEGGLVFVLDHIFNPVQLILNTASVVLDQIGDGIGWQDLGQNKPGLGAKGFVVAFTEERSRAGRTGP